MFDPFERFSIEDLRKLVEKIGGADKVGLINSNRLTVVLQDASEEVVFNPQTFVVTETITFEKNKNQSKCERLRDGNLQQDFVGEWEYRLLHFSPHLFQRHDWIASTFESLSKELWQPAYIEHCLALAVCKPDILEQYALCAFADMFCIDENARRVTDRYRAPVLVKHEGLGRGLYLIDKYPGIEGSIQKGGYDDTEVEIAFVAVRRIIQNA